MSETRSLFRAQARSIRPMATTTGFLMCPRAPLHFKKDGGLYADANHFNALPRGPDGRSCVVSTAEGNNGQRLPQTLCGPRSGSVDIPDRQSGILESAG